MTASSSVEPSPTSHLVATPTKYRLSRRLGVGGMGEVLLGTLEGVEGFQRLVAVKILHPELAHFPEFPAMFAVEANLTSQLNHPNLVNVIDFNRDAQGRLFLVMEYVDGLTLAEVLRQAPALPPSLATYIATEMLRGLGYAHQPGDSLTGVVHRDLSPRNVLVSWRGAVKVSDFGIAKALRSSGVSGRLIGTAAYMAPEQARASSLDQRADLFALGVIWWEMLTGRRLFDYPILQKQLEQVLFAPILQPRLIRPDIPEAVERIVLRLLERDRDKRYARAEDVLAELTRGQDVPRGTPEDLAAFLAEHVRREGARAEATTLTAPRRAADVPPLSAELSAAGSAPAGLTARRASSRWKAKLLAATAAVACVVLVAGHSASEQRAPTRRAERALEGEPAARIAPVPAAPTLPTAAHGSTPAAESHRVIAGDTPEVAAERSASKPAIAKPTKPTRWRDKPADSKEPPPLDFVRIQLVDGKANHL